MAGMIIKEKMAIHKSIPFAAILQSENKTAYFSYNSKNYIILCAPDVVVYQNYTYSVALIVQC